MSGSGGLSMDAPREQASGALHVRTVKGDYLWTISGFSRLDNPVGSEVESAEFELLGHRWKLFLYPRGENKENADVVSLWLVLRSERDAAVGWFLNLIDKNGKEHLFSARGDEQPEPRLLSQADGKDDSLGFDVMKRSELLDPNKGWLDNDTLRLKATVCRSERVLCAQPLSKHTQHANLLGLSSSFGSLLESHELRCRNELLSCFNSVLFFFCVYSAM